MVFTENPSPLYSSSCRVLLPVHIGTRFQRILSMTYSNVVRLMTLSPRVPFNLWNVPSVCVCECTYLRGATHVKHNPKEDTVVDCSRLELLIVPVVPTFPHTHKRSLPSTFLVDGSLCKGITVVRSRCYVSEVLVDSYRDPIRDPHMTPLFRSSSLSRSR